MVKQKISTENRQKSILEHEIQRLETRYCLSNREVLGRAKMVRLNHVLLKKLEFLAKYGGFSVDDDEKVTNSMIIRIAINKLYRNIKGV